MILESQTKDTVEIMGRWGPEMEAENQTRPPSYNTSQVQIISHKDCSRSPRSVASKKLFLYTYHIIQR